MILSHAMPSVSSSLLDYIDYYRCSTCAYFICWRSLLIDYITSKAYPTVFLCSAKQVIFADGTFVDGSTSELSCDGPLREPFTVFCQVTNVVLIVVFSFWSSDGHSFIHRIAKCGYQSYTYTVLWFVSFCNDDCVILVLLSFSLYNFELRSSGTGRDTLDSLGACFRRSPQSSLVSR